jgi:hypothetical protein
MHVGAIALTRIWFKGQPANPALFIMACLGSGWWRQTGSNRRPEACKATALPTELCPQLEYPPIMVGLGGLEPPTSRLSSARSNQLSYRPNSASAHYATFERKRNEDGGIPQMDRDFRSLNLNDAPIRDKSLEGASLERR